MVEATDFKFGVQIHRQAYKPENAKVGQKEASLMSRDLLCNFCNRTTLCLKKVPTFKLSATLSNLN